jgi:hypothetical protein
VVPWINPSASCLRARISAACTARSAASSASTVADASIDASAAALSFCKSARSGCARGALDSTSAMGAGMGAETEAVGGRESAASQMSQEPLEAAEARSAVLAVAAAAASALACTKEAVES